MVGRWPHTFMDPKIDHAEQHVHMRVGCFGGMLLGLERNYFTKFTSRHLPPGVPAITSRPPRDQTGVPGRFGRHYLPYLIITFLSPRTSKRLMHGTNITQYHKLKLRERPTREFTVYRNNVLDVRMTAGGMRQCGTDTVQKNNRPRHGNNYKNCIVHLDNHILICRGGERSGTAWSPPAETCRDNNTATLLSESRTLCREVSAIWHT